MAVLVLVPSESKGFDVVTVLDWRLNNPLEKLGSPHVVHSHEVFGLLRHLYMMEDTPIHFVWYQVSQLSQHTAF